MPEAAFWGEVNVPVLPADARLFGALFRLGFDNRQGVPWVAVSKDKRSFVLEPSGKTFTPWGFNYDHDHQGRLLEDYWASEWATVEEDFKEMKALGAKG